MGVILNVRDVEKYYGKIFTEVNKGEGSRKDFFNKIIEVVTLLGGETENEL